MKDRIRDLLLQEGLTSGAFADEIGVQRSSLSHILNGRNKPSLDFVIKTKSRFPKLSLTWLVLGKEPMYISEYEANKLDSEPSKMQSSIFDTVLDGSEAGTPVISDQESYNQEVRPDINDSEVDHIVIFYRDMSFRTYKPRK